MVREWLFVCLACSVHQHSNFFISTQQANGSSGPTFEAEPRDLRCGVACTNLRKVRNTHQLLLFHTPALSSLSSSSPPSSLPKGIRHKGCCGQHQHQPLRGPDHSPSGPQRCWQDHHHEHALRPVLAHLRIGLHLRLVEEQSECRLLVAAGGPPFLPCSLTAVTSNFRQATTLPPTLLGPKANSASVHSTVCEEFLHPYTRSISAAFILKRPPPTPRPPYRRSV